MGVRNFTVLGVPPFLNVPNLACTKDRWVWYPTRSDLNSLKTTVDLRPKGPRRKVNPLIREIISGFINFFPINCYIGYKRISIYKKN